MSEPASKRVKTGEQEPEENLPQQFEALAKLQEQIEDNVDQETARLLEVRQEFALNRNPLFEQRTKILEGIPGFWLQVFLNHPVISVLIGEQDVELLSTYFKKLNVHEDITGGSVRISFEFSENKYLVSNTLWKEFSVNDDGTETVTASPIQWKPGQDLTKTGQSKDEEPASFFNWFSSDDQDFEAVSVFKQLWANPLDWFATGDSDEAGEGDADEPSQ